jgi:putative mRNA 3-end processing factor
MQITSPPPEEWLRITPAGLYCSAGDFVIDPTRPASRALITHGHADHARPGNGSVLATSGTIAVMRSRFAENAGALQAARYGETIDINGVKATFLPAGHVLGSAQILLESGGRRVVVSGDYKRRRDPTCEGFSPISCDVFITEATFGLPVFHHPPDHTQISKILEALKREPERCVLIGAYSLGKCQRVICLLREAGYHETIYLHGAVIALCDLYRQRGAPLGSLEPVLEMDQKSLQGKVIMAPPSALNDRWSRRLPDPICAMASGWMAIRARARQSRVELPLVISDHADWDELTQTLKDVGAPEIWVTHGREDAIVYWATQNGFKARPLEMQGYDDEGD